MSFLNKNPKQKSYAKILRAGAIRDHKKWTKEYMEEHNRRIEQMFPEWFYPHFSIVDTDIIEWLFCWTIDIVHKVKKYNSEK